jgi:hypothetical protein
MFNPWLSLSFQAARLGWETQTAVVDQLMRIAGARNSDRKAIDVVEMKEPAHLVEDWVAVAATPLPIDAGASVKSSKRRDVMQKIPKSRKRHGHRGKLARSK